MMMISKKSSVGGAILSYKADELKEKETKGSVFI